MVIIENSKVLNTIPIILPSNFKPITMIRNKESPMSTNHLEFEKIAYFTASLFNWNKVSKIVITMFPNDAKTISKSNFSLSLVNPEKKLPNIKNISRTDKVLIKITCKIFAMYNFLSFESNTKYFLPIKYYCQRQ